MSPEELRLVVHTVHAAIIELQRRGFSQITAQSILDWASGEYDLTTDQINMALLALAGARGPIIRPHFSVRCRSSDGCMRVTDLPYSSFEELDQAIATGDSESEICFKCREPLDLDRRHVMVSFVIDDSQFVKKNRMAS